MPASVEQLERRMNTLERELRAARGIGTKAILRNKVDHGGYQSEHMANPSSDADSQNKASGAGSFAPIGAPYLTTSGDSTLSNEQVLADTGTGQQAVYSVPKIKRLTGGTNVTLTSDVNAITIAATGGASAIDDLSDVDTTNGEAPAPNEVLKWNGTKWVPGTAGDTTEFSFLITSFATSPALSTQEIGAAGTWKAIGALDFVAAYQNGPPTSGTLNIYSGASAWSSALDIADGTATSAEVVPYPTPAGVNHGTITFRLTADTLTRNYTVTFANRAYWGTTTKTDTFVADDITNDNTPATSTTSALNLTAAKTFTTTAATGRYVIYAYPKSEAATATFTDNTTGLLFAMAVLEVVDVTNASGYTEAYNIYRSTNTGLGAVNVTVAAG